MKHITLTLALCSTFLGACSDSNGGAAPANTAPEGGTTDAGTEGGPEAGTDACAPLTAPEDVVRVYGSAWNEHDAAKRLCALEQSLVDTATYVDPTIDTSSREGLSDAIGAFFDTAPDAAIVMGSGVDARSGELRFEWWFQTGGTTVITGYDYMELAADGRIQSIRGYWDPVPTAAPEGALADYVRAWTEGDASALGDALADAVFFTAPNTAATGLDEVSAEIPAAGATGVTLAGAQAYPKYARVLFDAETPAGTVRWTDYLHLDDAGRIVRIARFEGGFPGL